MNTSTSQTPIKPLRQRTLSEETVNRVLIGVTGGSAAGKTTLCQNIQKLMSFDSNFNVLLIALDSFYKPLDKTKHKPQDYNFDSPDALDFDMAYKVLKTLLRGDKAEVPEYCFVTHNRKPEVTKVVPTEVIIFEGILALYDRRIRDLMRYKIFINCDDDVRLCRRIKRDVEERGRTVQGILFQYHRFVKPAFTTYIAPTMRYADLVIPGFRNNKSSVTFIVEHLKTLTRQMEFFKSALTTRIYFFGQVIDVLLQQPSTQSDVLLDIQNGMEFIFPLSSDIKKELELFMNQLINQRFTKAYYNSVFVHQFMRILSVQFSKLVHFKKYNSQSIELVETFNYQDFKQYQFNPQKSVYILFIPFFNKQVFESVFPLIKRKPTNSQLVILNIWCDHRYLLKMKKQNNCCIINLICLCDEKKFLEIICLNVRDTDSQKDLFQKQSLFKKSFCLLKQAITNKQCASY